MKEFVKSTFIGGLLFLLPGAFVLYMLGYAVHAIATQVVQPLANKFQLEHPWLVALCTVLLLILVSFVAGIIARTRIAHRVNRWFSILDRIPQYEQFKRMAQGFERTENKFAVKPVLARTEGGWEIGFLVEPPADGWATVYFPDVPQTMSGRIAYLAADRLRPLDLTVAQATELVKSYGVGSSKLIRTADLAA